MKCREQKCATFFLNDFLMTKKNQVQNPVLQEH